MGWLIIAVISALLGVSVMVEGDGTAATVNNVPVGAGLVALAFLCALLFVRAKKRKARRQKALDDERQRKFSLGIDFETGMTHIDGLPLAQHTGCRLALSNDHLSITGADQTFQIALTQIIAAQSKSDVEIQQEVTSSMGKAVVGGFLFGPVGAIVGSRPKTKKQIITSYYLIINYTNQAGETAVISFEDYPKKNCDAMANAVMNKVRALRGGSVTQL